MNIYVLFKVWLNVLWIIFLNWVKWKIKRSECILNNCFKCKIKSSEV